MMNADHEGLRKYLTGSIIPYTQTNCGNRAMLLQQHADSNTTLIETHCKISATNSQQKRLLLLTGLLFFKTHLNIINNNDYACK